MRGFRLVHLICVQEPGRAPGNPSWDGKHFGVLITRFFAVSGTRHRKITSRRGGGGPPKSGRRFAPPNLIGRGNPTGFPNFSLYFPRWRHATGAPVPSRCFRGGLRERDRSSREFRSTMEYRAPVAGFARSSRRRNLYDLQGRPLDFLTGSDCQSSISCISWMRFCRTPMMGWMGVYNLGLVGRRRFHGTPSRLDLLERGACAGVDLVANPPDAGAR